MTTCTVYVEQLRKCLGEGNYKEKSHTSEKLPAFQIEGETVKAVDSHDVPVQLALMTTNSIDTQPVPLSHSR